MAIYKDVEPIINKLKYEMEAESLAWTDYDKSMIDIGLKIAINAIVDNPTADVVEVKHGEWKRNERNISKMREFHKKGIALSMSEKSIFYTCSCCGSWGTLTQNYCSICGAKMDGRSDT